MDLVKIAPRGVELDGLVSVPADSRGVLLHFHGLAGNFYENTVVLALMDRLNRAGYGFVSGNLRGHDYIADAVLNDSEWVSRGGAHTLYDEYVDDIGAWVSWAKESFALPIVVEGHSSGAVAVAGALLKEDEPSWVATVLLSPADMRAEIRAGLTEERFDDLTAKASALAKAGVGDSLLPDDALDGYPIDANCWLEMTDLDGPWSSFSWASTGRAESALSARPTLVVYGMLEDGDVLDVREVLGRWGAVHGVDTEVVGDAGHSYRGQEARLCDYIVEFLGRQLPAA